MDPGVAIVSQLSTLLKPIRELASNWDIDIACELEDYISNLSDIDLSVNGVQINFAEAALMIQGSAAIYSKKVEYLYTLIFRTLEHVSQQEAQQTARKASSIQENGIDEDVFEEAPLEFLSLDDIVENNMADNIDLEEDWTGQDNSSLQRAPNASSGTAHQRAALRFAFSLGNTASLSSQSTTSLDLPSVDNPRINGSDFRMNSCLLAPSGALMLGSSMDLLSQTYGNSYLFSSSSSSISNVNVNQKDSTSSEQLRSSPSHSGQLRDTYDANSESFDGDNDGQELMDDFRSGFQADSGESKADKEFLGATNSNIASNGSLLQSESEVDEVLPIVDRVVLQTIVDPWKMHDPHNPGSSAPIPFVKGRPFRLPTIKSMKKQTCDLLFTDMEDEKENLEVPETIAGVSLLDINFGLKKPFMPEFAEIFEREAKENRAARLKQRKQAIVAEAARGGFLIDEASVDLPAMDDDQDDNDHLLTPFGAESNGILNGDRRLELGMAGMDLDGSVDDEGSAANDIWMDSQDEKHLQDTEKQPEMTYEEHCKARLEEYFRSAQQWVGETELSARIEEWSSKLTPLLNEQEARPSFDIQHYATKLIEQFPVDVRTEPLEGKVVTAHFSEFLQNAPAYEVCRSFTSMLQLANMGNIKIHANRREADGLHDITLQLLTVEDAVDIDSIARFQPTYDELVVDTKSKRQASTTTKAAKKATAKKTKPKR